MNLGFGKKKDEAAPAGFKQPAFNRISDLSSQGFSEPEIIRQLRSEGYSPMEVDAAMKRSLREVAVGPQPGPPARQYEQPAPRPVQPQPRQYAPAPPMPPASDRRRIFPEEGLRPVEGPRPPFKSEDMRRMEETRVPGLPELGEPGDMDIDMPEEAEGQEEGQDDIEDLRIPGIGEDVPRPSPGSKPQKDRPGMRREMEELAESIVEEKADVFSREVDEVSDQVKRLESKLRVLEERFQKIEGEKKSEVDEIKQSITDYGESITEVSSRMESVERAMKDSLTPMMQTLRSLSDAIRDLKRK